MEEMMPDATPKRGIFMQLAIHIGVPLLGIASLWLLIVAEQTESMAYLAASTAASATALGIASIRH